MDPGPLVTEQIEAGTRFLREFQQHYPVEAAFWLKDSDESGRYLYVASPRITDDNFDIAYGEVARIAARLQDPWFDPFLVKVIGSDHPLARAAADLRRRFPGSTPARLFGTVFGHRAIDDVYLYPSSITAPVA